MPPKYQKIQSILLKYTVNNRNILYTQCRTPKLTKLRKSFDVVQIQLKCDKLII